MKEVAVDLRTDGGREERRRRGRRAAGFVIAIVAILLGATLSDKEGTSVRDDPSGTIGTDTSTTSATDTSTTTATDTSTTTATDTSATTTTDTTATTATDTTGTGTTETSAPPPVVLDVDPPRFGLRIAGETSPPAPIVVTNAGLRPVSIVSVTPATDGAFRIASDSCSVTTIQPGKACTVSIGFTPTGRGPFRATFTIAAAGTEPRDVQVEGIGAIRGIRLSPEAVRLSAGVGAASRAQVEVSNIGDVPVELQEPVIDPAGGPFTASGCSGATLAPGGPPCPVTVVFKPGTSGRALARLSIRGEGGVEEVARVTGFASEPLVGKLDSDPGSPIVMTNDPPTRTVTVTNVGTGPVALKNGRSDNAWLTLQKDGCSGSSLAPGQSCTFVLSTQAPRITAAVPPFPRGMRARVSFDVEGAASSPFAIDIVTR